MKNRLVSFCILVTGIVSAQGFNLLNVKSPEEFAKQQKEKADSISNDPNNKPLEYGVVEDKDIMWSKIVWETVDMNQLINQPYYHASKGIAGMPQLSLFDVIKAGLDSGKIKETYSDESFTVRTNYKDAMANTSVVDSTYAKEQLAAGQKLQDGDVEIWDLKNTDIKLFKIMGMWYFDKKLSELRYRPLGIAFMGPDIKAIKANLEDGTYYDLFWVWYADCRDVLNQHKVFSGKNSSADISFDDMINARRFSSIIYKEQNMQGRAFEEVFPGDAEGQLKAGAEARDAILNYEDQLWNR